MNRRKIIVMTAFLVVLFLAAIWQFPALAYQFDYQQCRLQLTDHYSNIASLNNAPDRATYNEQAIYKCQGRISVLRLETAETEQEKEAWGLKAIAAYDQLINQHHIDFYRSDRAFVYSQLGQYSESLADYNHLIADNPDSYWMYESRAQIYLETGQPELALTDYQTAFQNAQASEEISPAYLDRLAATIKDVEGMVE